MTEDDWTTGEIVRAIGELRDDFRWLRNLLIGTLASAIIGSIVSSTFIVITR